MHTAAYSPLMNHYVNINIYIPLNIFLSLFKAAVTIDIAAIVRYMVVAFKGKRWSPGSHQPCLMRY